MSIFSDVKIDQLIRLLGDSSPWGFCIYVLQEEALTALCLHYLFKDVCIVNSLAKRRQCLLLEQRADKLTVKYKMSDFPKPKIPFLQSNPLCVHLNPLYVPL